MSKKVLLMLLGMFLTIYAAGAISVTSPSSAVIVEAADDYATREFQDSWDMNEQTDLGWFIWDVISGSKSNLSNISFSGGIFSASATNTDPNIYILESGLPGTCQLGKIGIKHKIDASTYKVIAYRMNLGTSHDSLLFWSRNTIYDDITRSNPFSVYSGWNIYIKKIPSLGTGNVLGTKYSWSGDRSSLRYDPVPAKTSIKLDWIRLVEDQASLYKTINWNGNSGNVDIYLDNDKNEGNGTLGRVAVGVSGTSYSLYVGALEPGINYYVGVKNSSGGSLQYSSGYYKVNEIPTLTFTSPSEEGGDDFATVELGNAWDMSSISDIDGYANLTGAPSVVTINAVNRAGQSLGTEKVLKGTSKSGSIDPIIYLLWFDGGRGAANPIDTSKYRILVLKMGLPGNWDLVGGSVARIYWHVKGEFNGSVEKMHQSADVVIRHKSGTTVIDTVIADMKSLPLEASQSYTGWTGLVDGFRVDPHEFSSKKTFYINDVRLAAFERANESYTFRWNYTDNDSGGSPTLSLYRDNNNSGFNGTLIASGIDPTDESYTWNTASLAEGTYYIYATFSDGTNSNRTYARWPIVVSHTVSTGPAISLSKSSISFNGSGSSSFNISNSGDGTLNWSVSDNKSWLSVSPSSGQNSGTVTVTANASGLSAGTYNGTVTVSDSNASNSPRTVSVTLNVSGSSGGTPKIKLSRSKLHFGYTGGKFTGPQKILISNSGSGTLNWTVSDNRGWIKVSPSSGTNSGVLTVSTSTGSLNPGTYSGTITVSDPNASNNPRTIAVTLKAFKSGSTGAPFGSFATPTHNSTVRSSIAVTGWVVDDVDIASVKIYNGSTYIGDAVFVEGARPDVESAYPEYPKSYAAGWGYMLLTYYLPNGGNGTYTLIAKATDSEGKTVTLGSKTIKVDNANADKPFGALDTPEQGGAVSGSKYINWGWALTPQTKKIATNGSTIKVVVDGVNIGNPNYNIYREDIARLFPGYRNTNGAVGYFYLDTTAYENGIHSIQWVATDSSGKTDGIGSRFFSVENSGSNRNTAASAEKQISHDTGRIRGSRWQAEEIIGSLRQDRFSPVRFKRGFDNTAGREVLPDDDGHTIVYMEELDRIVLTLEEPGMIDNVTRDRFSGYLAVGDQLQPLPVGSTLDTRRGKFYWSACAGFYGDYELVFIDHMLQKVRRITVHIAPKYSLE